MQFILTLSLNRVRCQGKRTKIYRVIRSGRSHTNEQGDSVPRCDSGLFIIHHGLLSWWACEGGANLVCNIKLGKILYWHDNCFMIDSTWILSFVSTTSQSFIVKISCMLPWSISGFVQAQTQDLFLSLHKTKHPIYFNLKSLHCNRVRAERPSGSWLGSDSAQTNEPKKS